MRSIAAVLAVVSFAAVSRAETAVAWRSSFKVAQAEAVKDRRLLFVEFTVPG